MKSYTRVELRDDGLRHFRMQLKCLLQDDLRAAFEGRKLRACRIPKTQSKRMAWHVVLE